MTTKRSKTAPVIAQESDFYRVELSGRFERRGTTYLPGGPIRVSAAMFRDMTAAGVIAHGQPV